MLRVLRFVSSGLVGLSVNVASLYVLADILGIHYLLGSFLAVSVSTVIGFLLQKYWTFEAHSKEGMKREFSLYVAVAVMNIFLNTLIVYLLVDFGGIHHLLAQFVGAGTVAVSSFIIYKKIIFTKMKGTSKPL